MAINVCVRLELYEQANLFHKQLSKTINHE